MSMRFLPAFVVVVVFVAAGCGGGPPRGPFATPELPPSDPLVIDLAECRGDGASVEACVVDRVCAHVYAPEARRFHIRPVGSAPWVQVELGDDGSPESIELAWTGESATEFEVGLTCAPPMDLSLGDEVTDDELRRPGADGQEATAAEDGLLTLAPALRTGAEARAAFEAAEDEGLDGQLVFQHALWLAQAVAGTGAGNSAVAVHGGADEVRGAARVQTSRRGEAQPGGQSTGTATGTATGGAQSSPEYALLQGALTSAAVVELLANTTLDRGPRYRHEPLGHRWPLAQVLFVLRDGESAESDALLLGLVGNALYAGGAVDGSDEPADWLTLALAGIEALPPEALGFLRTQLETERAAFAFATLVDNGSDDAVEALRGYLGSRRAPFDLRAALLRENIAAERHLVGPVSVAERLLAGRLPGPVRNRLLEDLFGDWTDDLRPDTQLICPALERVSPESAAALRRIGANPRGAPARTRRVVAAGLGELPAS